MEEKSGGKKKKGVEKGEKMVKEGEKDVMVGLIARGEHMVILTEVQLQRNSQVLRYLMGRFRSKYY